MRCSLHARPSRVRHVAAPRVVETLESRQVLSVAATAEPIRPAVALTLGQETTGSIATAGETDEFTFAGAAGQTVFLDVRGISPAEGLPAFGVNFKLIGPGGVEVLSSTGSNFDFDNADKASATFPTAGQYRLVASARDERFGSYRFALFNTPTPTPRTIQLGEVVTDSIATPGLTNEYRFFVPAGQRLFFDVRSVTSAKTSNFNLDFKLIDPNGATVFTNTAFNFDPKHANASFLRLAGNGTYRLIADGQGDNFGSYVFKLFREGTTLVSGSGWSAAFLSALSARGQGDGGYNVRSQGQIHVLPWSNINRLTVDFGSAVNVTQGSLALDNFYADYQVVGFNYNAAAFRAMWTLDRPLVGDVISFEVNGTPIGGRLYANPGDVDTIGGVVNASDLVRVRNGVGTSTVKPGAGANVYSIFSDVNADGVINAADLVLVRNRIGNTVPGTIPTPNLFALFSDGRPLAADALDAADEKKRDEQ